jgi:hypothetical protein
MVLFAKNVASIVHGTQDEIFIDAAIAIIMHQ